MRFDGISFKIWLLGFRVVGVVIILWGFSGSSRGAEEAASGGEGPEESRRRNGLWVAGDHMETLVGRDGKFLGIWVAFQF